MPRPPRESLPKTPGLEELSSAWVSLTPVKGPPSTEEEKRDFYLELIRLKTHRKTDKECGERLGVSERSISNYKNDPLYSDLKTELANENKEGATLLVSDMAYQALLTMKALMDPRYTVSEYVRYSAARTVGEWLGLNVPPEAKRTDSQQEVIDFLEKLANERPSIQVNHIHVSSSPQEEKTVVEALPAPDDTSSNFPQVLPGGRIPSDWS